MVSAVSRIRSLIDSGAIFRPEYKEGGPASDPGIASYPSQLIADGKPADLARVLEVVRRARAAYCGRVIHDGRWEDGVRGLLTPG